ncbi:uncharacterized protein MONOS_11513 [Monocercomonoides exilis]|uniref:uncharacterized protein n=1 Tax=Monocercomonoides exilis TaxID=2049356 RepID=UPI00355A12ED|nr:hypothetical protein MONOS_11513 [Monocercomonoides exilis]|eukprot:MONOS_11513.1-p1 / transcript=MONOS_11513.1 / gene=MONOS_11513 / organism=Monocercomonoides_exilis_PA203 / gene_product=unspecified product / transcript_product=unspecified product / location=Mono_scaffold00582:14933-15250(+) / protein_length=106 / sequence_SO=supercontig / SO=protein_coding / is_pseudo=false
MSGETPLETLEMEGFRFAEKENASSATTLLGKTDLFSPLQYSTNNILQNNKMGADADNTEHSEQIDNAEPEKMPPHIWNELSSTNALLKETMLVVASLPNVTEFA